jgi:hypothetical protein
MAEVEAYAVLIERWAQAEKSAEEDDRKGLGLVAISIRRFLRGRPWIDEATRQAALDVADRAGEVAIKCLAFSFPVGTPSVGTSSAVDSYTEVIRNLTREEMFASGADRAMLGLVAAGIAAFLRRRPWIDEATQQAGFALADRAEAVAQKCRERPLPWGQT